jgi:hypothetical protein
MFYKIERRFVIFMGATTLSVTTLSITTFNVEHKDSQYNGFICDSQH